MRLIFSTSLLIISIALFFIFINPTFINIKDIKQEVLVYNTALDNSTELQKTRDSIIDIYKKIKQEDKDKLSHFLPSNINNIDVILEIEKIANFHGMPIKNINFETQDLNENNTSGNNKVVMPEKDPADNLPYGIFPMEFVLEGRYDTFLSFLNDLESNLRLINIKSISFIVPIPDNNPESKIDPSIYNFKLSIEIYWLK